MSCCFFLPRKYWAFCLFFAEKPYLYAFIYLYILIFLYIYIYIYIVYYTCVRVGVHMHGEIDVNVGTPKKHGNESLWFSLGAGWGHSDRWLWIPSKSLIFSFGSWILPFDTSCVVDPCRPIWLFLWFFDSWLHAFAMGELAHFYRWVWWDWWFTYTKHDSFPFSMAILDHPTGCVWLCPRALAKLRELTYCNLGSHGQLAGWCFQKVSGLGFPSGLVVTWPRICIYHIYIYTYVQYIRIWLVRTRKQAFRWCSDRSTQFQTLKWLNKIYRVAPHWHGWGWPQSLLAR